LYANRNVFRDSVVLQQLCEEEAEAGWILLENSMIIVCGSSA